MHQGRLAPSPTGFLHLGNAWSFLWAWLWAKSQQGRIILRIEDIDPARSKTKYIEAIKEDLQWLGLHWDGDCILQSSRNAEHVQAIEKLKVNGHVYPCYCTRKELRSLAGAPHIDDMGAPYTGLCASLTPEQCSKHEALGRRAALRLRCPKEDCIEFEDIIFAHQSYTLQQCGGDFALRRSDGVVAYQLAVVVDDAAQGITHVLRGSDILASTPRQILICKLLGLNIPQYAHVPLLLDDKGERLAKRHESLTLRALKEDGVSPESIVGLFAYLSGLRESITKVYLLELMDDFDFAQCLNMQSMKEKGITLHDKYVKQILQL